MIILSLTFSVIINILLFFVITKLDEEKLKLIKELIQKNKEILDLKKANNKLQSDYQRSH